MCRFSSAATPTMILSATGHRNSGRCCDCEIRGASSWEGGEGVRARLFRGAGAKQIVAEHDRLAALLGGPSVRPGPPGPVAAEAGQQLVVVAGQVVLGEQVDLEGGLGDPGRPGLVGGP